MNLALSCLLITASIVMLFTAGACGARPESTLPDTRKPIHIDSRVYNKSSE